MLVFAKLVGLLLNPVLWLVLLLIGSASARQAKARRRLLAAALATALLFSNGWIAKNATAWYQSKPLPMRPGEQYEACILLSGMAGYDEKDLQGYFSSSADRFIQTLRLYQQRHVKKIIVTGGQGNPFARVKLKESDFLVHTLLEMGLPATDIVNERQARNTMENAANTKRLLNAMHIKGPVVLITSAVHMPRALKNFRVAGIAVRPFPCDYAVKPGGSRFTWQSLLPTSDAFQQWHRLLQEMTGMAFLWLKGS